MAGNAPERFRRQNKIIPEFVVSVTPGSPSNIAIEGQDCDVLVTEGIVWMDFVNEATTTTGFIAIANTLMSINVKSRASFIATAAAKVQIIIYE